MPTAAQPAAATDRRPVSDSLAPLGAGRFGFDEAVHLLWRAGFGCTPQQASTLAAWGLRESVDHLVDYDKIDFAPVTADTFNSDIIRPASEDERRMVARARQSRDEETVARFRFMRQQAQRDDRRQMQDVQRWWIERMIETPRPLEEKLTLFWHGHFATSYRTIEDSFHMFRQNQLFRSHAAGNFGELLYQIIRDPAMLAYLDNNDSRKGRPNENLAREIMELFALGVGNYTEQDIKEGARALTGYTFVDDDFVFNTNNHDTGRKRILGRSGTHDGDDFVRLILERRQCARFIAGKLYRYFVCDAPTGREDLDRAAERVIDEMASMLIREKYELAPVLRTLFASEHFYDPAVRREQIKSPAVLVVGAVRSLLTPARDLGSLTDALALMGQNLFYPPSVAGWSGGRTWINTSTLFIRQNILCYLLTGRKPERYDALANADRYDPSFLREWVENELDGSADLGAAIIHLLRFTVGRADAQRASAVREFFRKHGDRVTDQTIAGALVLITAMPEYQLC